MTEGKIVGIYLRKETGEPVLAAEEARAIAGRGIEGDHGFAAEGHTIDPSREATLIESEAIEALEREYKVALGPGAARRNIVTRGVALNHLVGREFKVGEAKMRGMRLCEPCDHLAKLTQPKTLDGLVHRGGLRAQILEGGTIRVGDSVGEVS